MTIQYKESLRDAQLELVESETGTSAKVRIFTGSPPADCATADSGTKLVEIDLDSDWMAAASSGEKAFAGSWTGTVIADETVGHFRVYDTAFADCYIQGTCTISGGGGDMTVDDDTLEIGQTVTVLTFTIAAGNA